MHVTCHPTSSSSVCFFYSLDSLVFTCWSDSGGPELLTLLYARRDYTDLIFLSLSLSVFEHTDPQVLRGSHWNLVTHLGTHPGKLFQKIYTPVQCRQ